MTDRTSRLRRTARRVPLLLLVAVCLPGCVAANPFYRVTAAIRALWAGF